MEKRQRYLFFGCFVWTVLAIGHVKGFPTGAPNFMYYSCTTLIPGHDYLPQTTAMPYNIMVNGMPSNGSYDATRNYRLRISSKTQATFKGFIVQARQYTTSSDFTTFGSFSTAEDAKATCEIVGGATVTHVNNDEKIAVQFTWIAPPNAIGNVQFRGTVVQSFSIFWEIPGPLPPETTGEPPVAKTECGKTKGCFFSNCADPNDPNHCEYGVTWAAAGPDGTAFELFASATFSTTPYVALGLSKDTIMGDDSVTDCNYNRDIGKVDVQMSWNSGRNNLVLNNKTLSLVTGSMSGSFSNGMLICRFTRLTYPPSTNTRSKRTDPVFYPGTDLYHILIAKGITKRGVKTQHRYAPANSATKVNFTQFIDLSETPTLSPLIKAYGIMVIFAWMACTTFGMLMPRYYKTAWLRKKWGGKEVWFQLRIPLSALTFLLSVAAFIVIFIQRKGYFQLESGAVAHPPLTYVVMAPVVINPFLGGFRPNPKSERRRIFDILHVLVGLLAHLSAAVTLFLAIYMTKLNLADWCRLLMVGSMCVYACIEIILAIYMRVTQRRTVTLFLAMYIMKLNLPDWSQWIVVGYVCWQGCIEIILAIHMPVTQRRNKAEKNEIAMHSIQNPKYEEPKLSKVDSYSLFRTVLGVLHLVGVLGCAIALSVQIGIS